MRKKDFIISILAHLMLAAIIVIVNPISAMFKPDIEIMKVQLGFEGGPQSGGGHTPEPEPEPAKIAPPKAPETIPDQEIDDAIKIKSPNKKEIVEKPKPKPKPPKPKPKPIDESNKVEEKNEPSASETKSEEPKPDGKGGLEVTDKVGGVGTGSGSAIGSSNLPYNLGMVLSVIERNWRNPVSDVNPITCTIYFQIDRYGYVVGDPIIEKSSGIIPFDQGCILAIKRAGQFPAFPPNFNYNYVGLHLDFEYVPGM